MRLCGPERFILAAPPQLSSRQGADQCVARPQAGDRVVEVACGTGVVARLAAAKVGANGAVVGVDLNPGMLIVARSLKPTDSAASVE
jgi:ubiquinone/menaquinone biosynthesis C-methylase UbiE